MVYRFFFYDREETPAAYALVDYGEVHVQNVGDGLVIRNEEVYTVEDYGQVDFHAPEGERVEKNDLLATLFKTDYDEQLMNDLYQVQQKISKYQQENILNDVIDRDLERIQSQIEELISDIQSEILKGSMDNIDKKENQLRLLLQQRQSILDNRAVPDEYLQSLYTEEAEIKKQIEKWKVPIIAPSPGIVSFHVDGLENILDLDAVDVLTIEQFDDLLNTDRQTEPQQGTVSTRPLFRIVDPLKWYIACEFSDGPVYFETGHEVSVEILGHQFGELEGRVYNRINGEDSTLIIVEMRSDVDPFINLRNVRIRISRTIDGIRIPKEAIIQSRGKTGVRTVYQGDSVFVQVKIKAMDEKYAIVQKIGDVEGLNIGDQVLIQDQR